MPSKVEAVSASHCRRAVAISVRAPAIIASCDAMGPDTDRSVFSTLDDFATMHRGIDLDPDFALPGIVSLELRVEQRRRTADFFEQQQIAIEEPPDGGLVVPASGANGAILFFSEGQGEIIER